MEFIESYQPTVLILGLTGILFWIQLAVSDVFSIKSKHTPGYSVEQSHDSFLFRAHRVIANSNETVGILLLLIVFAILSSADAQWLNSLSISYLAGRITHMVSYYANLKLLRSIAFAVSFVSLLGIFIIGAIAWL